MWFLNDTIAKRSVGLLVLLVGFSQEVLAEGELSFCVPEVKSEYYRISTQHSVPRLSVFLINVFSIFI